jgi:N-acetylneuraminate synthase
MKQVFIIAEAGVNHNGKLDLALKLCDKALEIGADAVKFQTFKTELIVAKDSEMAEYQKEMVKQFQNQFDMIKALELSYEDFKIIKAHCDKIGIEFMSTPDEEESLDFLVNLGVKRLKIGSGEVDNVPFLRRVAQYNLPTIFSTGMSTLADIELMITTLFKAGMDRSNIMLLHCNTEYPTPLIDVNLKAMNTLKNIFDIRVGYSDHTLGTVVAIAATALGAECIEKHFTLDNEMEGPDHKASLNPKDFKEMIDAIKKTELLLGNEEKNVSKSEGKNKKLIRKVMVAQRIIKQGDILSEDNLCLKRSSAGISGFDWDLVIGKKADRDYERDQVISKDLLK